MVTAFIESLAPRPFAALLLLPGLWRRAMLPARAAGSSAAAVATAASLVATTVASPPASTPSSPPRIERRVQASVDGVAPVEEPFITDRPVEGRPARRKPGTRRQREDLRGGAAAAAATGTPEAPEHVGVGADGDAPEEEAPQVSVLPDEESTPEQSGESEGVKPPKPAKPPKPPTDPQPEKGQDCSGKGQGKGKGSSIHCG